MSRILLSGWRAMPVVQAVAELCNSSIAGEARAESRAVDDPSTNKCCGGTREKPPSMQCGRCCRTSGQASGRGLKPVSPPEKDALRLAEWRSQVLSLSNRPHLPREVAIRRGRWHGE